MNRVRFSLSIQSIGENIVFFFWLTLAFLYHHRRDAGGDLYTSGSGRIRDQSKADILF